MALPWVNDPNGTAGTQLSAPNMACDSIGGGAGGNATFLAGGLGLGSTIAARFTQTRRLRNDHAGSLIYTRLVFRAASNPANTVWIFANTTGGVNKERSGLAVTSSGKIRLIGGTAPDASNVDTDRSYADGNIWCVIHCHDVAGVTNARYPGTPIQRMIIYRETGKLVESWDASIVNTSVIDASYWGIITDLVTWTIDFDLCQAQS